MNSSESLKQEKVVDLLLFVPPALPMLTDYLPSHGYILLLVTGRGVSTVFSEEEEELEEYRSARCLDNRYSPVMRIIRLFRATINYVFLNYKDQLFPKIVCAELNWY